MSYIANPFDSARTSLRSFGFARRVHDLWETRFEEAVPHLLIYIDGEMRHSHTTDFNFEITSRGERYMQYSFEDFDFSRLSPPERLLLAQELLDSVYDVVAPFSITDEQLRQLQARSDDFTSGRVQGVPWEQVKAHLLADQ